MGSALGARRRPVRDRPVRMRGRGRGSEHGCFSRRGGSTRAAEDSGPAHHERFQGWLPGRGRLETGRYARSELGPRLGGDDGVARVVAVAGGVVRHGPPGTLARLTTNGWVGDHDRKTGGSQTPPLRKSRMGTRRGGSTRASEGLRPGSP